MENKKTSTQYSINLVNVFGQRFPLKMSDGSSFADMVCDVDGRGSDGEHQVVPTKSDALRWVEFVQDHHEDFCKIVDAEEVEIVEETVTWENDPEDGWLESGSSKKTIELFQIKKGA